MKKVITYGTYDLLNPGHVNLLRRAKELGDFLIVGLSTDEFNTLKNKKAALSYEQRKFVLEAVSQLAALRAQLATLMQQLVARLQAQLQSGE